MARRRFFVLDETLPGDQIEHMMGRVVLDIRLPLRAYAPVDTNLQEKRHNPQDIIPSILSKPSLTTNRSDFLQGIGSRELQISLTDYFGINFARTDGENMTLKSQTVSRYTLSQNKQYFDELMKDPLYSRDVRQLLRDHKSSKAYFVVGFMTTEGAVWKRGSKQEHTTGVTVKAPVSLATGMPSQLDPGIAPSYTQSNAQEHAFAAPQTEIFAVAYDVVKLNRSFDKTAPNYVRSEPALGPAKRAKPHHLAMGGDSDEEIEEEEDETEESETITLDQDSPPADQTHTESYFDVVESDP